MNIPSRTTGDQSNDFIPWLRFLAPLSAPGTCCLIWEMRVLTSGTLHQTQLAPVTPAPLSFGDGILSALLTSASWIWRALFARWMIIITNYCNNSILLNTPSMGKATTYRKRCLKYGGRVITFIRNRVYPQVIHRGMVDEHSFPGRLETKVMIHSLSPFPFTRYPHLGPAASFGKCVS
ncbi:hypothetical protein CEXT_52721 [Caerostris extrusa]|uniref:Uncharacterized protein n=1 Tax=Caerostris extrusa TaxID=172846 RepID=A0AAV4TQI5_CAEEX|nr:hypothetical protein CEXT_52721 [Caerostris extrusa]